MESLGICLGASTISLVRMRKSAQKNITLWTKTKAHEGNPRRCLNEMLVTVDGLDTLRIGVTGRKFRRFLALSSISEPEAVELACHHALSADHPCRVVVSAGGETFMVYHLNEEGKIQGIHTGNKCASGTGEFFLQQLGRMGLNLEGAGRLEMPDEIYKMSGRCSVFCKSDCTHALNKGITKARVVGGLSSMMAGKIVELLKKLPKSSVMLVGGCCRNESMVHYLREEIEDVVVPEEAPCFEALGAALWALDNETVPYPGLENVFLEHSSNLTFLKPLNDFKHMVHFKEHQPAKAEPDDHTILGLDVGSTTTKGVIMRRRDKAILASRYLRTNGDPIGASCRVYASLAAQIDCPIVIEGLGVTGSGRQIAGLHAMTDGVINEIIAHATAAVYFDPEVDTIFEIGGQDAKYTYITNGVPSDYAMNEACSAGTGSFLEESAQESLGLPVTEIGKTAYTASSPANFNDQCAAFISADIKGAIHEGVAMPDIVAGLVYSICMNYTNRVKGKRPVGKKVFIQGGVCYNEAIPAAMAALTGKEMVVPPDPGLMGAFGVALEVERRMEQGLIQPQQFDLAELVKREVKYGKPFVCGGGKECDRGCTIARIVINDKVYPFGGICNRYDNIIHHRKIDSSAFNIVAKREQRVFRDLRKDDPADMRPTVGMNRSFLINTYFPFFNSFFDALGYRLVLPDTVDPDGIDQQGAAFCFPAEISHGYAADLLTKNPDFFFLPHLRGIATGNGQDTSCTCVLVQGEPFYLQATFAGFSDQRTIMPTLDFSKGMTANLAAFQEIAERLGVDPSLVKAAVGKGMAAQDSFYRDIRKIGSEALASLREDPGKTAIVLFGRPYNSFTGLANKGIPEKFASRGHLVVPFDMLPYTQEELEEDHNMYWAMGRMILQGAHFVKKDPQLYGTYVTNFSCGPDSFIVGFFRDIMGRKPSLTLELDSHTADAGIETRIEAFLDIVQNYRRTEQLTRSGRKKAFQSASMEMRSGKAGIMTSEGRWLPLMDPQVKVIIPAMGRYATPLLAKVFARLGIRAEALPPADDEVLKLGRGNSSCKECLPLQTTVGSLLHYLRRRQNGEVTAYFMASAEGPCRFGQYHVFSKRVIEKREIPNAAVLSLTSMNGYGGLGNRFTMAAWRAVTIGDLLDEIWAVILAAAEDQKHGLAVLEREYQAILGVVHMSWQSIARQLSKSAAALRAIPLKKPYDEIPKLSLIGEIYVRHDPIALQNLNERLADNGFIVRTASINEWLRYVDWMIKKRIEGAPDLAFWMKHHVKRYFDQQIRKRLAASGLVYQGHNGDVEEVISAGRKFISPNLPGEAILTVGSALHEILDPSCGIISIGPFGCMPSRLAESILTEKFTSSEKKALVKANGHGNGKGNGDGRMAELLENERKFPFLAIETDGNAFPQIIEARLEAFCLQAHRLNEQLQDRRSN